MYAFARLDSLDTIAIELAMRAALVSVGLASAPTPTTATNALVLFTIQAESEFFPLLSLSSYYYGIYEAKEQASLLMGDGVP